MSWRCLCKRWYGTLIRCPDCKAWAPSQPEKLAPVQIPRYRRS